MHAAKHGCCQGLSEHVVKSADDVYQLLARGKQQRATNGTHMNRVSSRRSALARMETCTLIKMPFV